MNLNCFAVNKPECFWCNINLNLCKWIYLSLYLIRYADRLKSVQKVKRIAFSSRVDHWYFFFVFNRRIPSEQWTHDSRDLKIRMTKFLLDIPTLESPDDYFWNNFFIAQKWKTVHRWSTLLYYICVMKSIQILFKFTKRKKSHKKCVVQAHNCYVSAIE